MAFLQLMKQHLCDAAGISHALIFIIFMQHMLRILQRSQHQQGPLCTGCAAGLQLRPLVQGCATFACPGHRVAQCSAAVTAVSCAGSRSWPVHVC